MKPKELKELRESLSLSQTELSNRLQLSRQTVVNYETGVTRIPYVFELALKQVLHERNENT